MVTTSRKRKGNGVGKEPIWRWKRAWRLLLDDACDGGDTCPEWYRDDGSLPARMQQACRCRHVIWAQPNHTLLGGSCCGACIRARVDQCFVMQALACAYCISLRNPRGQCLAEPPAIATLDSGSPGIVVPHAHTYDGSRGGATL